MKLTIEITSSSLIMMMLGGGATPLVQASLLLPSSINPRDMNIHHAQEQELIASIQSLSLSSSVIRGNFNSKNQRRHDHRRGRSRQVQETNSTDDDNYTDELDGGCDDVGTDYFHNALDFSLSPLYDEVECEDDEFIDRSYCSWGNLTANAHFAGAFDYAIEICQDDGGTYYNIRGQVDCDNQSTTFLNYHPFGCFSDCSMEKLQSLSSLFPAEPFAIAGKDNTTSKCEWLWFEAYSTTIYNNASIYGTCNDVIAGQNHVSDAFDALYQKYYNFTCKDDGKHCKEMTYSNAYNDGAFDSILAPCLEEGGELYVDTITIDCGVDGSTEYPHYPHCVSNCTIDKLARYMTDESLWDDCTYAGDYEIFQYTSDNNGTADNTPVPSEMVTILPTKSPVAADTPVPSEMVTMSPTMAPVAAKTPAPSEMITVSPTMSPTAADTPAPSEMVTMSPTMAPVAADTPAPSAMTTASPTMSPVAADTPAPSETITTSPTMSPVVADTPAPSAMVTMSPTMAPVAADTPAPSEMITTSPTMSPVAADTPAPSTMATTSPSEGVNDTDDNVTKSPKAPKAPEAPLKKVKASKSTKVKKVAKKKKKTTKKAPTAM